MKRIVVIGSGGAGKSTFSKQLGEVTGLEVIHLDALYWKPNWEKTPADQWERIVADLLMSESWIMDGNFGGTREIRMEACDTIIFLDMPRWLCMYRILKRVFLYRGKTRPDMADGCAERFDWEFIMWVWNYRKNSRVRVLNELKTFGDKQVFVLNSKQSVTAFLSQSIRK